MKDVVIIGVGQLRSNRERDPEQAVEPLALIDRAIGAAAADAGIAAPALAEVDAVGVVQVISWSYEDVARAVAERIGAGRARTLTSEAGGHQPVVMLAELAAGIAAGESELAVLCGGEAQSSLELLGAAKDPAAATGWSHAPGGPARFAREVGGSERMWELGLVGPIRVYPLFENRLRHDLGQTFAESQQWSGDLYARFSEIAAANDAAWNPEPASAQEIAEPGPRNRMICFPYPLRMNALARVDQAAALLLASRECADRLGVPEDRRVYVDSLALADDCDDVLERPGFGRSPGLERTLDQALDGAAFAPADVDVLDLYSCFPVVPKLGALHLGLDHLELTATGGLTSFGGPHNNYSSHALVAVVRRLREGARTGLVYANGEYLTRHAAVVLNRTAPTDGLTLAPAVSSNGDFPVDDAHTGELELETFTVEFDREAQPARGYVLGRSPSGARTGVRVSKTDTATLAALVSPDDDPIGRRGTVVRTDDDRRVFTFAP